MEHSNPLSAQNIEAYREACSGRSADTLFNLLYYLFFKDITYVYLGLLDKKNGKNRELAEVFNPEIFLQDYNKKFGEDSNPYTYSCVNKIFEEKIKTRIKRMDDPLCEIEEFILNFFDKNRPPS